MATLPICVQPARAEASVPPREFWDYLIEFGDASGDVFDPNDLAITAHVRPANTAQKNNSAATQNNSERGQPNATDSVEQPEVSPGAAPVAPGERSE
jgi:hypothetical protein